MNTLYKALFTGTLLLAASAASATDLKILSSGFCQGWSPQGRQYLKHHGSSLEAVGKAVTVVCPLMRDNSEGRLLMVSVRLKRLEKNSETQAHGSIFSCSNTGGCSQQDSQTHDAAELTTMIFNEVELDINDMDYYFFKTVLPAGWKLVSITYREQ